MAHYVLLHGAGSDSWYWHLVVPRLEARGHEVLAVDLPCDDDSAGLAEYTDAAVAAIGDRPGPFVVVAQSMAAFTAPLLCDRVPVCLLVLVAAMAPRPGETPGEWWANTGWVEPPGDLFTTFMHDLPPDLAAEAWARGRAQSGTPFGDPWPLDTWPDVPTRFLLCGDDRFFPADFQRRVVSDRLGIMPDEMDGGHLPALGRPDELAERLAAYGVTADQAVQRDTAIRITGPSGGRTP